MKLRPQLDAHDIEDALTRSAQGEPTFYLKADEPGLRLRCRHGEGMWILQRRAKNGARVPLRLGMWPRLGIAEACETARLQKLKFADNHGKPLRQRGVREMLERYELEKLSPQRSAATTGRSLRQLFAPFMDREIRSIRTDELRGALAGIGRDGPIHANRCLAYAHAFFNWAVERRYMGSNPASAVRKFVDEPVRMRLLSLDELGLILMAARRLTYPFGPAIELMALLPFKREVISCIRRRDLRFEDDAWIWTRPGLLMNDEVHGDVDWRLPPLASEVVSRIHSQAPVNSEFLLSGNGLAPISGWSKAKARLMDELADLCSTMGIPKLEPWRLEDLRRSFADLAPGLPYGDYWLVGRCLDRGDRFRSLGLQVYARTQEVVSLCTPVLENWGEAVLEGFDRVKSQASEARSPEAA